MTLGSGRAVVMTDEDFRLLRDLIEDHCGIHFPESVQFLLERRLQPRLPFHGLSTFRDYYRMLRYGSERGVEIDEIVDRVTINETYFFRERYQLTALQEEILPEVLSAHRPHDIIRIWSAGCSTGEEPFSVAMMLTNLTHASQYHFEIFGNDISRKALKVARTGLYRSLSLRDTAPQETERFFRREGEQYRLQDVIRKQVTFGHLNLMDERALALINDCDVILCRNVMIYFSPQSRQRLLGTFLQKLRPGGYLLLGHAESLLHVSTDFEMVPVARDIVYRKPKDQPNFSVAV